MLNGFGNQHSNENEKKKTFSLKYVKTKAVTGICQTFQSFVKKKAGPETFTSEKFN